MSEGLVLVGLLPLLAGLATMAWINRPRLAFHLALGVSFATIALALAAAGVPRGEVVRDSLLPAWIGVDGLSGPLLPFEAVLLTALVAGEPRATGTPRVLGALLVSGGATLLMLESLSLPLLVSLWALSFAPALALSRDCAARPLVLVGAVSALALEGAGVVSAWLPPLERSGFMFVVSPGWPARLTFGLVLLAALLRCGALPAQIWITSALSRGSLGLALHVIGGRAGVYVLLRLFGDMPAEADRASALLGALGLATALYGAVLGLAQTETRRVVASLAIAHGGMILVGLSSGSAQARIGVLLLWWSLGVAWTGLALVGVALEARCGRAQVDTVRGIGRSLPGLGAFYLVCGACCVGFPGSLGFVAEELLTHGLFAEAPLQGAGVLLVMALNGMVVVRSYLWVFMGPLPGELPGPPATRPRERLVFMAAGAVLFGFGLRPALLIEIASEAVRAAGG